MKNILIAFLFTFSSIFAFGESVKPTYDIKLERKLAYAIIDEEMHLEVTVELKAAESAGVRVIVTDNQTGERIYKMRFPKSYLYAFSDGTIQVGKGNALTQISILKINGEWKMILKEKGIY